MILLQFERDGKRTVTSDSLALIRSILARVAMIASI